MKGTEKSVTDSAAKPFPVRLNELKAPLQMCASDLEWSTHHLIRNILEEWVIRKFNYKPDHFKKLRAQKKAS